MSRASATVIGAFLPLLAVVFYLMCQVGRVSDDIARKRG